MSKSPLAISVSRTIAADPDRIYDLVSDVTLMPRWSPETTEARWLRDETAARVGARFEGTNAIGTMTWKTKPTITEATPGSVFAFRVPRPSNSTWRFEFEGTEHGTIVTERLDCPGTPAPLRFLQRRAGVTDRAADLRRDMLLTLERLGEFAEATSDSAAD